MSGSQMSEKIEVSIDNLNNKIQQAILDQDCKQLCLTNRLPILKQIQQILMEVQQVFIEVKLSQTNLAENQSKQQSQTLTQYLSSSKKTPSIHSQTSSMCEIDLSEDIVLDWIESTRQILNDCRQLWPQFEHSVEDMSEHLRQGYLLIYYKSPGSQESLMCSVMQNLEEFLAQQFSLIQDALQKPLESINESDKKGILINFDACIKALQNYQSHHNSPGNLDLMSIIHKPFNNIAEFRKLWKIRSNEIQ